MVPRIILIYSSRSHYCKGLLNVAQKSLQNRHINYSLSLPLKYFLCKNVKLQIVPSIFNYIFHQIHLKYYFTNAHNEVENLCHFILPENFKDHGSEKVEELKKIIMFLLSKGYSCQDIKDKFLDCLKTGYCSYVKICSLADIDSNIPILLPLLSLSESMLKLAAQKSVSDKSYVKDFSNRILYLSHHLELESHLLIPILAKHPKLLTMKFQRLESKLKILKDAHISPKYIVKDLWIFNYTEEMLANRIQAALKAGVELKPWMLRCTEKFFKSMLFKYSEIQRILCGDNVYTYLAKKLDCSTEYVDYMMKRNKLLKSINIPKLEQIINFLYQKGYTPEEVRLFPRVFCSSVKTLEKRFEEFQSIKSTLPTLAELCMSNKKARSKFKKDT